ncbi:hypothetical protein KR044_004724, partial [Drosophila immigrans]
MHIDEFIYRVRSLTEQNLKRNYKLLCDHLHLLFNGKASDWYWKFHRNHDDFTWETFCKEFRERFDEGETDLDLMDKIRK